jgi:hypothetical protein
MKLELSTFLSFIIFISSWFHFLACYSARVFEMLVGKMLCYKLLLISLSILAFRKD